MERQLAKMMAPSAYIYTVSYNELQDALSGAAFKLISDQDQAKGNARDISLQLIDSYRLISVSTRQLLSCIFHVLSCTFGESTSSSRYPL